MPPPKIVGHRGAAGLAPENTVPAFRAAVELGVEALELDARLTRDGRVVVIHDPGVERTTNGSGRVAEMTLAEVQALDARAGFPRPARIPTLEEALAAVPERVGWLIEMKSAGDEGPALARGVLEAVEETGCRDRARIISFYAELLGFVRRDDPEIALGFLIPNPWKTPGVREHLALDDATSLEEILAREFDAAAGVADRHACEALLLERGIINRETVGLCRGRGFRVSAWTANQPEEIRRLAALGVDEIITDYPDVAIRELR